MYVNNVSLVRIYMIMFESCYASDRGLVSGAFRSQLVCVCVCVCIRATYVHNIMSHHS